MKDKNIEIYYYGLSDCVDLRSFVDGIYRNFSEEGKVIDFDERNKCGYGRVIVKRNGSFPEDVMRYIVSKSRRYIPTEVSCPEKGDYSLIEKILKEEQGDSFRLTRDFVNILQGSRNIEEISNDDF